MGEIKYYEDYFSRNLKLKEDEIKYTVDSDKIHNRYDKSYKSLLSVKKNFIEFASGFMKEIWNEEITENDVELVDKEFITAKYTKKESDLVYKITQKENTIYFLLLEIQSKPDRKMAYRILNYEIEIWRKLENNRKKGEKFSLIPIIPCVIYNGKKAWNSPVEIKELYNKNEFSEEYLLKQKYILIDIARYNPDELLKLGNLISAVFYLDSSNVEELDKRLEKLLKGMANMSRGEKIQLKKWAMNMLPLSDESMEKVEEIVGEEEIEMGGIRSELKRWYNEVKRESLEEGRISGIEEGRQLGLRDGRIFGIEEGRQLGLRDGRISGIEEGRQLGLRDGKQLGMIEGIRQMLLNILPKKLGVDLPDDIIAGIEKADAEVITELENNIFSLNCVEDVVKILER